jgi:hypothetical protein
MTEPEAPGELAYLRNLQRNVFALVEFWDGHGEEPVAATKAAGILLGFVQLAAQTSHWELPEQWRRSGD